MTNEASGFEIEERRTDKSIDDLLHQEAYTPEELAALIELPLTLIEHEAFAGTLNAFIVEHRIVSISRDDALAWMRARG